MKYTRIIIHSLCKIILVFYSVLGKAFIQSLLQIHNSYWFKNNCFLSCYNSHKHKIQIK